MNETEYNELAEQTLIVIEEAVDASGADIDYDSAGGILTLEFSNGSQIIINKQTPLKQIWVAAKSGGYHFSYDDGNQIWCLNGDASRDLISQLSIFCSEQSGETVCLE